MASLADDVRRPPPRRGGDVPLGRLGEHRGEVLSQYAIAGARSRAGSGIGVGNFSGSDDAVACSGRSEGRWFGRAILCVKAPGTYLAFFSLHSIAVTALTPGHGDTATEGDDEFVNLCLFHGHRTETGRGIGDGDQTQPRLPKVRGAAGRPAVVHGRVRRARLVSRWRPTLLHPRDGRGLPASTRGSRAQ